MEYVHVTKDNLEEEHICCAISNNKDAQVSSKKAWLLERFDEGLVFLKSVERRARKVLYRIYPGGKRMDSDRGRWIYVH